MKQETSQQSSVVEGYIFSPHYWTRLLQLIHKQNKPDSKIDNKEISYFLKKLHFVMVGTNNKNNVVNH